MATAIIDLDELLGEDKHVKLRKVTYRLPPDLPVELYLKINNAAKQDLSEAELVETLYGELLELFRYGDPKITALPIGMSQLVSAIPTIYGDGETPAEGERPTTPKTRGGNGAAKPKSRSTRSSS